MPAARFLPVLISFVLSIGLWIQGLTFTPVQKGTYGVLLCGTDIPDREIRERLEAQGFTGIISESGQWVLVDSFGSIEQVSLDEFPARVLPFDPRNDGFADKLRSLFVRDEYRFIYIPLKFPAEMKKRLAVALGDIPYSFYMAAGGWPKSLFLALFFLAAGAFFFIRPLRLILRPHAFCLLPLLPALAPLALGGAAGFALASLLAGCAALLAGPYLQWRLTQPRRIPAQTRQRPPALYLVLPPMFFIFYGIIALFSGLHPLLIILITVFFCVLMVLQLRTAYMEAVYGGDAGLWSLFRWRKKRRFSPVPLFSRRSYTFTFSWAMLPFAAVALILAGVEFSVSSPEPAAPPMLPPADTITEADYDDHYQFQSTFSLRSLYEPAHSMGIYELTPDGLLDKTGSISAENGARHYNDFDILPFSLGDLLQYLDSPGSRQGSIHTLLAALLPLLFVFPILFRGREVDDPLISNPLVFNPLVSDPLLLNQAHSGNVLKRLT